jgi:hypothetical protein
MNPATLALVLAGALAGLAVVLNHCYARLALVELTLNEGLPPGHQNAPVEQLATSLGRSQSNEATTLLGSGVHIFLSRNCHACQRLIDEFDETPISVNSDLHLHYVDRPRPIAASAAANAGAELHEQHNELAIRVGADPLPYTVAVGLHGLLAQAVTPTIGQVVVTARDAGITMDMVGAS